MSERACVFVLDKAYFQTYYVPIYMENQCLGLYSFECLRMKYIKKNTKSLKSYISVNLHRPFSCLQQVVTYIHFFPLFEKLYDCASL